MPRIGKLTEIHTGASATLANRWSAANYFDKVIMAHNTQPLQYWPGYGSAKAVPGLPVGYRFNGCCEMNGHIVAWFKNRLVWNDVNDFSTWIPIAKSISTVRLTIEDSFTQPPAGTVTDWIYVEETTLDLCKEAFVRIDQGSTVNIYEVVDVLKYNQVEGGRTININYSLPTGVVETVFTEAHKNWKKNSHVKFFGNSAKLVVEETGNPVEWNYKLETGFTAPSVNSDRTITLNEEPKGMTPGDFITFNGSGYDIYEIKGVNLIENSIQVTRLGKGDNQQVSYTAGATVLKQHWFRVRNENDSTVAWAADVPIEEAYAVKLSRLDMTGAEDDGESIIAGQTLYAMTANTAGELVNAGDKNNGEIWQVVDMENYGLILKERSIQTMQYVGVPAMWTIRTEITDEGLLGKYTWTTVGNSLLFFIGHREIWQYQPGGQPQPIAQGYRDQFYSELDRSKLDHITMFDNQPEREVWIIYPVNDSGANYRVLIWNYEENTAAIDDYPAATGGLTAGAVWNWKTDVTIDDLVGVIDDLEGTIDSLGGETREQITVLATNAGGYEDNTELLLHGLNYNRKGEAYVSSHQHMITDGGDPARYKYVDGILMNFRIRQSLTRPARLFCQIGGRESLDAETAWSDPDYLDVSGNSNPVAKFDITTSGRYIAIKLYSQDANVQWEVTGFELYGRWGGNY